MTTDLLTESGVAAPECAPSPVDLSDVYVDYYEYECGRPCTPNGCCGHSTDIPVAITISGVTFQVGGVDSGDFPGDKEEVARVCAVVKALGALLAGRTA